MACAKPSRPFDVRLQKYLAACGFGSRRACERLIEQGVVAVDEERVQRQGVTIDPAQNVVTVRGQVARPQSFVYVALYKPVGLLCTSRDPAGRATFHDLLPDDLPRVFSVGRLDRDSEGLLLATNDGEWANLLQHPRHHITKTYTVWTDRALAPKEIEQILAGVSEDVDVLRALSVRRLPAPRQGGRYEIVLGEGRNRHIRRMIGALDANVTRLRRTRIGNLGIKGLRPGQWRYLTAEEVAGLVSHVGG